MLAPGRGTQQLRLLLVLKVVLGSYCELDLLAFVAPFASCLIALVLSPTSCQPVPELSEGGVDKFWLGIWVGGCYVIVSPCKDTREMIVRDVGHGMK